MNIHTLAFSISGPDGNPIQINPPQGIPTGGLETGGAGLSVLQFGVQAFFFAAALLAMIFILISGIKWITAGGDKTKVQSARSTLTYAIIGLVIVLGSFTVLGVLGKLLGFSVLPSPAPQIKNLLVP